MDQMNRTYLANGEAQDIERTSKVHWNDKLVQEHV